MSYRHHEPGGTTLNVHNALPPGATARSHDLFAVATDLAARCPTNLADEIFLAGSVARGWADYYSDAEVNFVCTQVAPEPELRAWLTSIGADEITTGPGQNPADWKWLIFRFNGEWIEGVWQEADGLGQRISRTLAGEEEDTKLAEALVTAVILRDGPILQGLRTQLAAYPEELRNRILEQQVEGWLPFWVMARWGAVQRNDQLWLSALMVRDCQSVLRTLFALNRRWEPDWKWLPWHVDRLEVKPEDLLARVELIVSGRDPRERAREDLRLLRDTFALLEPSPAQDQTLALFEWAVANTVE